jgi:hypothetical protein
LNDNEPAKLKAEMRRERKRNSESVAMVAHSLAVSEKDARKKV